MLNQWIACHRKAGDWQGAERVWERFSELGLQRDSRSYRAMLQVYTGAGGEQIAKIDPLLTDMQQRRVQFSGRDFSQLIAFAQRCDLPAEVHRWSAMAAVPRQ